MIITIFAIKIAKTGCSIAIEAAIEQFDDVWIGKFFASPSINAARTVADVSIVLTQLNK